MSEGCNPNINEIALQYQSIPRIPPSVTDINGQHEAPAEAGNVLPPPEERPVTPPFYKTMVPVGTAAGVSDMGRPVLKYKRKRSGSKRKTTTKRRGAGRGAVGKNRTKKRKTAKRSRASIVKRH